MELNPYTSETGSNALGVPGTTTVYGYENSTAQTYAEEHSFDFSALTPAAPGDLDGNEIFDLTDVTMLLKLVTEQAEDTSSAADVNDDGVIDLKDVTRLFQFVSGQIDTL
jgi:hypothetical protein